MTDFTAILDEATGATAAGRREQLDARLNALLAEQGAATFSPPVYEAEANAFASIEAAVD